MYQQIQKVNGKQNGDIKHILEELAPTVNALLFLLIKTYRKQTLYPIKKLYQADYTLLRSLVKVKL